jgi:subtilisin family serine protease
MKKASLFIVFLFLLNSIAYSQTYINKEWEQETGSPNSSLIQAKVTTHLDNSNDLIVVGHTINGNHTDILITKYGEDGVLEWQKQFNGTANGNDYGTGVLTDNSNNVYVIGTTEGSTSNLDVCLLKYDFSGTLQWTVIWNGIGNLDDIPLAITSDLNGNIVITGGTETSNNEMDFLTLKYDDNGTLQWSSFYDFNNEHDLAAKVVVNASNQIIVSGASASSANNYDFAMLELNNANGNIQNTYRYSNTSVGLDKINAISLDANNNVYITGYTDINSQKDIQTIKLDAAFNLVWVENFDGVGMNDVAEAIGIDDFGNVYITGYSEKSNGISDMITIKYDANGNAEWIKNYENIDGVGDVYATDLLISSQGEIIVAGSIENSNDKEMLTLTYDKEGNLIWAKANKNGTADEEAFDLKSDNIGNIYVTGIKNDGTTEEYLTLKYSTYERERKPIFNTDGTPDRLDNEVVVRFQPSAIIPSAFDNKEILHGTLADFLTIQALNDITQTVGFKASDLRCFKVHPNMTTADSLSLTRTGRWIKIRPFYATLVLIVPNTIDEVLLEYNLEQVYQHVQVVDLNHLYSLQVDANDTYYQNDSSAGLVATPSIQNANINIEPAWDVSVGDASVKVGIFDSGINYKHQDFGNGTWAGSVIKNGYDYLNNQSLPITGNNLADSLGHGTPIAGIIGAIRNNNFGTAGIAGGDDAQGITGVSLHDMKITSIHPLAYECATREKFSDNATLQSAIIEGASNTSNGFGFAQDVQNHSWGGPVLDTMVENTIQNAFLHGTIITVSSGNNATSNIICDNQLLYPASLKDDWIFKVGANDYTGNRVAFSACGYGLDVIAPGTKGLYQCTDNLTNTNMVDTMFVTITNQTCVLPINGTSFAAPHVAGTAALMISHINGFSNAPNTLVQEDCEAIIQKYATDVNVAGYDMFTGFGRLNAGAALEHILFPRYKVEHFNISTTNYTVTPETIGYARVNGWNGVFGGKRCRRYKITVTDNFSTGNYDVIDAWVRNMESDLIEVPLETSMNALGFDSDIPSDHTQIYLDSYTQNSATLSGYIYEILDTNDVQGGYTHLTWFPVDTNSIIEFAYTVHQFDSLISNVQNVKNDFDFKLFPQPASHYTTIQINTDYNKTVAIELYDITGRKLKSIYNGKLNPNQNEFILDTSALPNAMYIVTIKSQGFIQSKKLIIQK